MINELTDLLEQLKEKLNILEERKDFFKRYKSYPKYQKEYRGLLKYIKELKTRLDYFTNEVDKVNELNEFLNELISHKIGDENQVLINNIEDKIMEIKVNLDNLSKVGFERIYYPGSAYDFYLDIKNIIQKTTKELFIIDSWVDQTLFDTYIEKVKDKPNIKIKLLVNNQTGDFLNQAKLFFTKNRNIEVRKSRHFHDRSIFIDNEGWVMGQSIKDSAKKNPAYLIKLKSPKKLKEIYVDLWNSSNVIDLS